MGLLALYSYLAAPIVVQVVLDGWRDLREPIMLFDICATALWIFLAHCCVRRPFLLHLAILPLYLTTAADLFLLKIIGVRLTSGYIDIAMGNHADSAEFLATFATPVLAAGAALCTVYGTGMYCIRGFGKERAPRLAAASAAALAGAYLLLVNHFILWPSEPIRSVLLDSAAHENSAPLGVIFQSAVALSVRADNDVIRAHRGGFSFGASKPPSSGDEVYVWVIGESSRPKNWSLFGYARNTSPRLGAIPGIITFPDMLTTAPETLIAVPSMLSLRPITDWPGVQAQRSVVSAFNEAGFRTYWLSTQDLDAWAGIVPQIAAEAGTTRYFSQGYDGSMLGEFRRILDSEPPGNRKLFIVLHTKGSHFNYVHRYPREFAKFDTANPTRRDRIVDTYDNSVLYTDWFLSELISLLSARHTLAALLYASDHGENLLDDDRHLLGHTIGSKYDLSTASFLWLSDELWQRNPDLVANAERHASLPLSLSDLPHSMLHLAGIEAPQRDIRMSVFSASFEPHVRFYLLGGKVLADQPSSAAKR